MKSEKYIKKIIIKRLHLGFAILTIIVLLSIATIIVLSYYEVLKCNENYWIGNIIYYHIHNIYIGILTIFII